MYRPWKWLKRGNYSFFSHCRAGTKLLLALKFSLDDFSPELQYLPKKQNSGFLHVPIEHKEMSREIERIQISGQNTTWLVSIYPKTFLFYFRLQWSSMKSLSENSQGPSKISSGCVQPLGALSFTLMLWRVDGKYHRINKKISSSAPKSLSGMKRIEESFVPSLNNVNLCNTT